MNSSKQRVSDPLAWANRANRYALTVGLFILCGTENCPPVLGQTGPELEPEGYAALTIVGEIGKVYSIESISDLSRTNDASAWRCLEYLQLPGSPYLWTDKSAPATGKRFYRAVAMEAPTNMVFIPPGTFRMGSSTNEVDRDSGSESPQTSVVISRGFWMGKYEVTQGEYLAVMGDLPISPPAFRRHERSRELTDLGRCRRVLCGVDRAGTSGGADRSQRAVSTTYGGGVGVRVPGVDFYAVQLWG